MFSPRCVSIFEMKEDILKLRSLKDVYDGSGFILRIFISNSSEDRSFIFLGVLAL